MAHWGPRRYRQACGAVGASIGPKETPHQLTLVFVGGSVGEIGACKVWPKSGQKCYLRNSVCTSKPPRVHTKFLMYVGAPPVGSPLDLYLGGLRSPKGNSPTPLPSLRWGSNSVSEGFFVVWPKIGHKWYSKFRMDVEASARTYENSYVRQSLHAYELGFFMYVGAPIPQKETPQHLSPSLRWGSNSVSEGFFVVWPKIGHKWYSKFRMDVEASARTYENSYVRQSLHGYELGFFMSWEPPLPKRKPPQHLSQVFVGGLNWGYAGFFVMCADLATSVYYSRA